MADTAPIPNFTEVAQAWQLQLEAEREQIENQKKGLDLRQSRIKKREVEQAEKDKQLSEWERALNKQYEEVRRLVNVKKAQEKAEQDLTDADRRMKQVNERLRQAEELEAANKLRQEELIAKEQRILEREKTYREKIRQETVDAVFKNLTKSA